MINIQAEFNEINQLNNLKQQFMLACHTGNLNLVKSIYSIYSNLLFNDITEAFNCACIANNLNVVKWLFSIGNIKCLDTYLNDACILGNIVIAKWLVKCGADIHNNLELPFLNACISNNILIAKWLYKLGCKINEQIYDNIVDMYINLHDDTLIKWLTKHEQKLIFPLIPVASFEFLNTFFDNALTSILYDIYHCNKNMNDKRIGMIEKSHHILFYSLCLYEKIYDLEYIKNHTNYFRYEPVTNTNRTWKYYIDNTEYLV